MIATQLNEPNPKSIYTLLDEFSVFAGVHAVLATQSLADITKRGGEPLLGQILNNCNNYLIQRQNTHPDAELLANVIGTAEGYEVTSQLSTQRSPHHQGTIRQTRGYHVHRDDIKRLGVGEAVFVNKQRFELAQINIRIHAI